MLSESIIGLKYDKRIIHRFIEQGKVKASELENHLNDLPDLSDKYEDISEEIFSSLDKKKDSEKE